MAHISRRTVLTSAAAAGATALAFPASTARAAAGAPAAGPSPTALTGLTGHNPVTVCWVEGGTPAELAAGTTWGTPWPRGAFAPDQEFCLTSAAGTQVPVQSWPIGWWPDGSVKWTAHAVSGAEARSEIYQLAPGAAAKPATRIRLRADKQQIVVDTGVITVTFAQNGEHLIESITRGGTVLANGGRLIASKQDRPSGDTPDSVKSESFTGKISSVRVEQGGPVRAVIKVEGKHERGRSSWLPFVVRFYLYAGSDAIRMTHTFIFDGNENKDFINGLGVRFTVPMRGELHDRHVRLAGEGNGVLVEAVRTVSGLRRDPGAAVRAAQFAGQATPDPATWDTRVTSRLQYIPAFGDWRLSQLSADGFQIHKRTGGARSWVRVAGGRRASGLAYLGGPTGGLAFGMRNFWQLHPTELEVSGAVTDSAEATVWMWSPRAGSMDLRFYHDGMGQDTYAKQYDGGLEITYEDYEPGFGTPYGVARTTELTFWALAATPTAERFAALAAANATPPLLATTPVHNRSAGVFGSWAPVDRSVAAKAVFEDRLDQMHSYHREQVDQRSWYGFWDYGDIMHSYDFTRHTWSYDVGGYAWDNSELSSDLWIWYHYLRTGDARAFRFAEAMTRHTSEVDMYHIGKWKNLGTRHGVMHWGDSAKQVRISNACYKRFLYFLTADERLGDVMHDLVEADRTFLVLDPTRKLRDTPITPDPRALGVGTTTDWGALAWAWFTEWERNGDPIAKTKLINGATSIAALPNGWAQGGDIRYNLANGTFTGPTEKSVSIGSLSSVFGLIELMTELLGVIDDATVKSQWVTFCRLYNATKAEQAAVTGSDWGTLNLHQAYARATAYAARQLGDATLAQRAWQELRTGHAGYPETASFSTARIEGPAVLNPVDEGGFSANASAQYGLATIQCLALVGDDA